MRKYDGKWLREKDPFVQKAYILTSARTVAWAVFLGECFDSCGMITLSGWARETSCIYRHIYDSLPPCGERGIRSVLVIMDCAPDEAYMAAVQRRDAREPDYGEFDVMVANHHSQDVVHDAEWLLRHDGCQLICGPVIDCAAQFVTEEVLDVHVDAADSSDGEEGYVNLAIDCGNEHGHEHCCAVARRLRSLK